MFDGYYDLSVVPTYSDPVQVTDPVNEENNATRLYTSDQAEVISDMAVDAGDAIDAALRATTKHKTIYYWQRVFDSAFHV